MTINPFSPEKPRSNNPPAEPTRREVNIRPFTDRPPREAINGFKTPADSFRTAGRTRVVEKIRPETPPSEPKPRR